MKRNHHKNKTDRCLECGMRIVLHFSTDNRKLTCQEAADQHPNAAARPRTLTDTFTTILFSRKAEISKKNR